MVVYTKSVFTEKLFPSDIRNLSLNIGLLAVFYAFIGGAVSFLIHYLFDEFDDEWRGKTLTFQIFDISVEIAVLALVAFWCVFTINTSAPIFPVRPAMARYVDAYTSGMFFIYAIFMFMEDLTDKMKYLYDKYLNKPFRELLPTHGSILDFSLRYVK